MKTTICLKSGGRLHVQPSATNQSVQFTFERPQAERVFIPSVGFLLATEDAGVLVQAIEAVVTINEESTFPPELPSNALGAARTVADVLSELAE